MQVEIVIQSGKNIDFRDAWVVQLVKHLSVAPVMILESCIRLLA